MTPWNKKGKLKIKCSMCGSVFFRFPSQANGVVGRTRVFCSRDCANQGLVTKVRHTCQICLKIFDIHLSNLKQGGGKYCSVECRASTQIKEHVKCTCESCGKSFEILPYLGTARFCSKKCQFKEMRGPNLPQWRNGITKLRSAIYNLVETRIWRTHVFQRDEFTCQECGVVGGKLNVDHIIPFFAILQMYNITSQADAKKCDFLWDIHNGRTLCVPCHQKTPTYGRNALKYG